MTAHTLVVLSLERWDDVWRRNQYLIDGLVTRDPTLRVLFVEPPHDVVYTLATGRGLGRGEGVSDVPGYSGRLMLYQPTKWLPRVLGGAADALMRRSLFTTLHKVGLERPLLWVNDPSWAGVLKARPAWPSLYDITDDWAVADRPARELRRTRDNETLLLKRAGAVVVCSHQLVVSKGKDRDVIHVPNAVDVERYRRPAARPEDLPAGKTALYLGTLHEDRLDVDLTMQTARLLHERGDTLVLVGPNVLAPAATAAVEAAGARILGPRPYDQVPAYLQHATALIVPHVVNDFTESLDPLKLYEYLAVGRPVVTTPVAGFRELAGRGVTVADPAHYPNRVAEIVAEDPAAIDHPDVPDWSTRVEQFAELLADLRAPIR